MCSVSVEEKLAEDKGHSVGIRAQIFVLITAVSLLYHSLY